MGLTRVFTRSSEDRRDFARGVRGKAVVLRRWTEFHRQMLGFIVLVGYRHRARDR